MHVIWAFGQQAEFYEPDQLKYHGRKNRCKNPPNRWVHFSQKKLYESLYTVCFNFSPKSKWIFVKLICFRGVTQLELGSSGGAGVSALQVRFSLVHHLSHLLAEPCDFKHSFFWREWKLLDLLSLFYCSIINLCEIKFSPSAGSWHLLCPSTSPPCSPGQS